MFSLGCVFMFVLTGKTPPGCDYSDFENDSFDNFKGILKNLLKKCPDSRLTCSELKQALDPCLQQDVMFYLNL